MTPQPLSLPWQPLYPSQRVGVPTIEYGWWEGRERKFCVQWYEDRAYFQLNERNSPTWATLDSCAESDAVPCWKEALRSRRYGVCFTLPKDLYAVDSRCSLPYHLQFIYAPDGTGFVREWSSRDWIYFAPQETRAWALFPELILPLKNDREVSRHCCRYAIDSVRSQILFRPVTDEEIERLSWKSSTDESEFNQVTGWLWHAKILKDEKRRLNYGISLCTHPPYLRGLFGWNQERWNGKEQFFRWLRSYFVMEGFRWRQTDWGARRFRKLRAREPQLRAFLEPYGVLWHCPLSHASFHEQLEARLQLGEWLREKAPDANVEEWLSPQK